MQNLGSLESDHQLSHTALQVLREVSDLILATTLRGRHCYAHFTDEETEA